MMNSKRKQNDQPIKSVIRQMLEEAGLSKKYDEASVVRTYHEMMGPSISNRTKEVKMKERTLIIKLESAVLKEELSMNKSKLVQLINDKLGGNFVEDVEIW